MSTREKLIKARLGMLALADRPMQHALWLGAIGLAMSIVGAAVTWNKGPAFDPH